MDLITLDFETYWDEEYTLKKMTTEEYVRDERFMSQMLGVKINKEPAFVVAPDDIPAALRALDLPKRGVLAFNAQFDGFILNEHYGVQPGFWFDPLHMSYFYYSEMYGLKSRTLDALLKLYKLGEKGKELYLSRGLKILPPHIYKAVSGYCANDVEKTYDLFQTMLGDGLMPERELELIDATIRLFTEPVLKLNEKVLSLELDDFRTRRAAAFKSFGFASPAEGLKMLRSNDNFATLLSAFGIEPVMKQSPRVKDKMIYAFAKTDDFMQELLDHPNERVAMLADIKLNANSSILESRLQRMIHISRRSTMPVMLIYSKARTGRWGGSDKMNPQNFKKKSAMRYAIEPPEEYLMGVADSSNIEARMLATWAGQEDLVMGFRNKEDQYLKFAIEVYGRPLNKKENPTERFVGKTCILGLGYGTGATKLQHTLHVGYGDTHLDLEFIECKRIVDVYRSKYYKIPQLWNEVKFALEGVMLSGGEPVTIGNMGIYVTFVKNGVILPSGRILHYPNLRWEDVVDKNGKSKRELMYGEGRFRNTRIYHMKLVENIVQALSRDVVAYQLLQAKHVVDRVVMFTHDEIVFVHRKESAQTALNSVLKIMATAPQPWAAQIPLDAEGEITDHYNK